MPGEEYTGQQAVVALALSTGYLWDQVRVVGGAYGCNFQYDSTGVFTFSSYRDPQLVQTLERYKEAATHLKTFADSLDQRSLTRAILGVIRSLDKPITNDQKGYRGLWEFITQRTPEDRRRFRKQVSPSSTYIDIPTHIDIRWHTYVDVHWHTYVYRCSRRSLWPPWTHGYVFLQCLPFCW